MRSAKLTIVLVLLLAAACTTIGSGIARVITSPTAPPSPTPFIYPSAIPARTPTPVDTGWRTLASGLERRQINIAGSDGARVEYLYILRINPSIFTFDIAYDPVQPRVLQSWQSELGALVVVNGGYFSRVEERYPANGLLVIDGQPQGASYGSFAGMLAITAAGPQLRWLAQQPYESAEPLLAGLQSFPILVKPGGALGFPAEFEDNVQARRTVIAQDRAGRILFILAPTGFFTLHQLSRALTESDLALDIAINLDGGPSTGLLLAEPFEQIQAYTPLPLVILIYRK
jgi:hypothetical protein